MGRVDRIRTVGRRCGRLELGAQRVGGHAQRDHHDLGLGLVPGVDGGLERGLFLPPVGMPQRQLDRRGSRAMRADDPESDTRQEGAAQSRQAPGPGP